MLLGVAGARAEVSRLEALSQIETGNNDRAVGGAGEVSRYQIKPWIWRQYNDSDAYFNRRVSTQVAEQHLAELAQIFRKRTRREPTDFDLYVLWNAGPTYYKRIGFARSRVHPVIRERAQRYANLRQALHAQLAQATRPTPVATPLLPKPGTPAAPAPASPETLSPFLFPAQTASLQNPMFSLLPLASQPEVPSSGASSGQQPIFAIGGIPAK